MVEDTFQGKHVSRKNLDANERSPRYRAVRFQLSHRHFPLLSKSYHSHLGSSGRLRSEKINVTVMWQLISRFNQINWPPFHTLGSAAVDTFSLDFLGCTDQVCSLNTHRKDTTQISPFGFICDTCQPVRAAVYLIHSEALVSPPRLKSFYPTDKRFRWASDMWPQVCSFA